MSFLKVIINPRKTSGNIEGHNEESNNCTVSGSDDEQNTGERVIVETINDTEAWMSLAEESSSIAETSCTDDNNDVSLQPGSMISTSGLDTQDCIVLQQTPSRSISQQTPSLSMPPKRAALVNQTGSRKKKRVEEEFQEAFLEIEREKMNIYRKEQNEDNDDICWFKSLLPYVKQLPALKKLQFRTHIQEILLKELMSNE